MIHAFRLGPLANASPPSFAYVAVLGSGKVEVCYAAGDAQGLVALREAVHDQSLTCEPSLSEAAGRLGLALAKLPPEVVRARALLAYELGSGVDHGTSRPEALEALLEAAGAFWGSRAWELIAPEEQLHVTFSVGRIAVQGELSMQADDPAQPRLVLCDEAGQLERLHGLDGEARVAALVQGAGLIIELAKEPAWASAVLGEHFKLPRVPMPERRRGGRVASVATQDLVLAAGLLKAVVAYADLGDGSEVEVEIATAALQVRARLGPSPVDPDALGSGGP